MFDCCSGANFLEAEETFLNHKTVLEEAGVNTNELNGLDATHYQILEPITQTRVIEVEKEYVEEKIVEVPEVQVVDKYVDVDVPVVKYKPVYKKKEVVVERVKHVPKIIYEDKIVEVPQVQYVEKEVDVPQYVTKERIVKEPKVMVVERVIPILKVNKAKHAKEVEGEGHEYLEDSYEGDY
ncbi:Inner membrane complex family protein [Theileria parva strain Muguga]|uniref:Uncharacterized protein n=1 Tax=Theileria parva TaxID=5875 RepID=Q4N9H7_THEPA|nr:Inner membrane complex family protein [Theileria parva strain Muguga]EAN33381.1 Inner membrane complex family protein [Theileria parva strain Muguga]|eukprot:XP_765664.1 hypothetical protein [Theileria parva strain Muguga]